MNEKNQQIDSPIWNRNFKLMVSVAGIILICFAIIQFRWLVRYLVLSAMMAYLLNPLVELLEKRTPLKRTHSILSVYTLFLGLLIAGGTWLGMNGYTQINNLQELLTSENLPAMIESRVGAYTDTPYKIGPITIPTDQIDWLGLQSQLAQWVQDSQELLLSRASGVFGGVAKATYSTLAGIGAFLLIFVMSIYIMFDLPHLGEIFSDMAQLPGYKKDADRLFGDFGRIWRAYLRGQITLAIVMFLIVWLSLSIMGVNNAFALGLLAGALEFLPVVGPVISSVAAVIVALLQAPNWMGLEGWQLAVAVAVLMIVLQQIENNILVPRIVGQALDLHPLVTMVVVMMGASAAGILGAILAAPVAATIKILSSYIWRKLFDHEPFEDKPMLAEETVIEKLRNMADGVVGLVKKKPQKPPSK